MFEKDFSKVIFCYSTFQDIYEKMSDLYDNDPERFQLSSTVPWDELLATPEPDDVSERLVIIDDRQIEEANNPKLSALFTRGRHLHLSTIVSFQVGQHRLLLEFAHLHCSESVHGG